MWEKEAPTACSEPQSRDVVTKPLLEMENGTRFPMSTCRWTQHQNSQHPQHHTESPQHCPGKPWVPWKTPWLPFPSPGAAQGSSLPIKTFSTGQGAAAQWLWDITAGTRICWDRVKQKGIQACLGRKTFSLRLGLFQSKSLSAGLLARSRPQPGRQRKFMGLKRFQTKHSWLREAGLFLQNHSKPAPVPNRFIL